MRKLLEKALKDAIKENNITLGTRQVLNSVNSSKLIIMSKSTSDADVENITKVAKKDEIPTMVFDDTSVSLGKLCGVQFRVSTASFTSLSGANVKSILNEKEDN